MCNLPALIFALISVVYLLVGGLFAIRTPDWQTPDEPAHYNYIRQIAENGCCPVIAMGDWDSAYLEQLKSARFDPALLDRLEAIQYEDHQPPLYYLLLSPVYQLTGGSLAALRLASLVIGLVIVVAAYGVGLTLFPTRPEIGLGTAAFVAFQPQHLAILASVNNDALGWALVALALWGSLVYLNQDQPRIRSWHLGLLVGIAFITKATAYLTVGVVGLALLLRLIADTRSPDARFSYRRLALPLLMAAIPALLIGALWWLRNFGVYGFPDFLGLRAHDSVVVGQLRTADYIASLGNTGTYLSEAARTTFYSFWGMFGWQALPLVGAATGWIYPLIGLLLAFAALGWLLDTVYLRRRAASVQPATTTLQQRGAWLILAALIVAGVLAYFYYNTEFVQFQGRYMFTILIPLGLWLALGVDAWRRLLFGSHPLARWLTPLVFFSFAVLDVWLLWRVIVPGLAY